MNSGTDGGRTVELQLDMPIKIEPRGARYRFTRRVCDVRPRSDNIRR
jgi:hypothetical protein